MAPELGQRRAREAQRLGLAQAGRDFGLATRHDHHCLGFLLQAEGNCIVGRGIAGMQRRDHVKALGHGFDARRLGNRHVEKVHALETQLRGQRLRGLDQRGAGFNAVDLSTAQCLEEQVVEDEAQVGLACAVVGQRHRVLVCRQLLEQGLDELIEVVDLLELAA